MKIPLTQANLGEEEAMAAREAILSGWVTQGPRVLAFEKAFAAEIGAPYTCAVSNCTTGLHLALLAVGVKPGDIVITASHSFIATANAIRACQAEPFFVDIDLKTLNLDPAALEQTLDQDFVKKGDSWWCKDVTTLAQGESPLVGRAGIGRLAAIQVVHQVGMPADLRKILAIAKRAGLPLVEDAACAIGSEISLDGKTWEPIGKPHGDVACFSFHPRKVLTTGDGGMITTASKGIDRFVRLGRQHGMNVSDLVRHQSNQVVFEEYVTTAFNFRMTDIQAAIGSAQLARLPELIIKRRKLAAFYHRALSGIDGLSLPQEPAYARSNWQSYVIRLRESAWQRPVMQFLQDKGIATRRGVMCSHLEAPYREAWKNANLRNSQEARDKGIVLPLFPDMTEEMMNFVSSTLAEAIRAVKGES